MALGHAAGLASLWKPLAALVQAVAITWWWIVGNRASVIVWILGAPVSVVSGCQVKPALATCRQAGSLGQLSVCGTDGRLVSRGLVRQPP